MSTIAAPAQNTSACISGTCIHNWVLIAFRCGYESRMLLWLCSWNPTPALQFHVTLKSSKRETSTKCPAGHQPPASKQTGEVIKIQANPFLADFYLEKDETFLCKNDNNNDNNDNNSNNNSNNNNKLFGIACPRNSNFQSLPYWNKSQQYKKYRET